MESTAAMVPNTFNELLSHSHIPPDPEEDNEKLMQDGSLLCKIITYFSTWMFKEEYTNFSVKYKG